MKTALVHDICLEFLVGHKEIAAEDLLELHPEQLKASEFLQIATSYHWLTNAQVFELLGLMEIIK